MKSAVNDKVISITIRVNSIFCTRVAYGTQLILMHTSFDICNHCHTFYTNTNVYCSSHWTGWNLEFHKLHSDCEMPKKTRMDCVRMRECKINESHTERKKGENENNKIKERKIDKKRTSKGAKKNRMVELQSFQREHKSSI